MGTVHIAALFLPYTVDFATKQEDGPPAPPSPQIKRNSSMSDIVSRASMRNLSSLNISKLSGPTSKLTPQADTEEALNTNPFASHSRHSSHLGLPQHVDPLSLLPGDADGAEWGGSVYKQPRSRAGPMPSKSVADFKARTDEGIASSSDRAWAAKKSATVHAPTDGTEEYEEWTIKPAKRGNGGLVNAVRAVIDEEEDVHVFWVGTLGFATDALPENTKLQIQDKLNNDHDAEVVFVGDAEFTGHYDNFCKVILWPIFHYQVPDDVNSKAYMDHSWKYYYNVNRAFADQLITSYKRGDTIWVHDYQLLLVPGMVREKLPDAKIGFFLHTAFPSSEIFRCQWKYKDLLRGMLGANLVAFQLKEYADHFLQTCSRFLRVEAVSDGIQLDDRFVNVASQPIGINPATIDVVRKSEEFSTAVNEVQKIYEGKRLIVAHDKLDRVHGVRKTLLAYERFLNGNKARAKDTVLVQVATSGFEQVEESARVWKIINRINGDHGSLTQHPLVLISHDLTLAQYYALLTMADVYINSTQRDGMNLTAHDFIFCQDGEADDKKHGALILSEFAGSATVLPCHDLRTNPWDTRKVADAISKALSMDDDRKLATWKKLHKIVTTRTGSHWIRELDIMLADVHQKQYDRSAASVPRLSLPDISKSYEEASHRLFILDYEGTLISRQTSAGALLTSPNRVIDIVNDLMKDPKNVVYVISGSQNQQLSQIFQTAGGVGMIAENGGFLQLYGALSTHQWIPAIEENTMRKWKTDVKPILEYYQDRLKGSLIEEVDSSIVFRFNDVEDKETAERLSRECADQINTSCKSSNVRAVLTPDTLICESMKYDKSTTANTVFKGLQNDYKTAVSSSTDFLMVAGDDREDECVFKWANQLGKDGVVRDIFSVSIGNRDTEAKASMIKGSAGLLSVLEKLAEISRKDLRVKNPATKRSTVA